MADRADPLFKAYTAAEALATESWTAPPVPKRQRTVLGGGAGFGADATAAATAAAAHPQRPGTGAAAASAAVPPKTVLELFERQPHWKRDEAVTALQGHLESKEVLEDLRRKGDYLRSGRYIGHYICKTSFRTPNMPKPDPVAEEARVS
jgi:hypothetical protein